MDTLLTLSLGEYSAVEMVLHLTVALTGMASVLLALCSACVARPLRLSLIMPAVALGGASWFELEVWQSWKEAFELAGTSYTVTGYLPADENRIIAWSLSVPVQLFAFGLAQLSEGGKTGLLAQLGVVLFLLALAAPFSHVAGLVLIAYAAALLLLKIRPIASGAGTTAEVSLSVALILAGAGFSSWASWHSISLGGGVSGTLVRGEIIRSTIDILSLVIPALLLLIGVMRVSNKH
jgi:hypothetical protein